MYIDEYIKEEEFPLFICPGCTHGTVTNAFLKVAEELQLDKNKTILVSAIGCAGRIPTFLDFSVLRVTHGRALAFATGVKLSRPDMKVIVFMGDGDATAIGGNHLIHAARRNIDITAIISANEIYGMTGGQYAPTTSKGSITTTSPFGMMENTFDICKLVEGAGATYVARSDAYHVKHLQNVIKNAIKHEGFSVVEAITSCPTQYGRRNKNSDPSRMLEEIRDKTLFFEAAKKMSPDKVKDKVIIGEFVNTSKTTLDQQYEKLESNFKNMIYKSDAGDVK
ncbi:MAG: thiamine pyrophosphate-dependent enzyme [Bacillota bacterium]